MRNNPVNFVDPSGYKKRHHFWQMVLAIVAVVLVAVLLPEGFAVAHPFLSAAISTAAGATGAAVGAQVDRAMAHQEGVSTSASESHSPRGPPSSSPTVSEPGSGASQISQAASAVLTPMYNAITRPGWNYGEYLADLDAGSGVVNPHLYGAMLDSAWFISGAYAGIGLVSGGVAAAQSTDEAVTIYRGVGRTHPGFRDALRGIAKPRGGHASPYLHNRGFTESVFTSWTTDRAVAEQFAGENGAIMQLTVSPSRLIPSRDYYRESEVLIRGVVRGAKVIKR